MSTRRAPETQSVVKKERPQGVLEAERFNGSIVSYGGFGSDDGTLAQSGDCTYALGEDLASMDSLTIVD